MTNTTAAAKVVGIESYDGRFTCTDCVACSSWLREVWAGQADASQVCGTCGQPMERTEAAPAATRIVFETGTCGRCSGTGHHSFNQVSGSKCFGCNGRGTVLTRRGAAARKAYDAAIAASCTASIADLKDGDRVFSYDTAGTSGHQGWVTVVGDAAADRLNPGFHRITTDRGPGRAAPASLRIRVSRPAVQLRVMADTAARFAGAELV